MELSQLLRYQQQTEEILVQRHPDLSPREYILARLSKLSEEVGEFNAAALTELGFQRQEKLDAHHFEHLEMEWADVFKTLLSCAVAMHLDVEKILDRRTQQIFERFGLEMDKETK